MGRVAGLQRTRSQQGSLTGAEGTSHILTMHDVYNRLFNLLTTFLCY